jgi:hypothetical protein
VPPGTTTAQLTIAAPTTGTFSGAITSVVSGSGYSAASPPLVTISAPDPLAAVITYTLDGNAQPVAALASASNGPYSALPTITSMQGGTCVDTSNSGNSAILPTQCAGFVTTIQTAAGEKIGRVCNFALNTPSVLPIATNAQLTALVATAIPAPGISSFGANVFCTSAPTITLSTNTLQAPVQAQANAIVDGAGAVPGLNIVSGGSGYRTTPTITVAAPVSNVLGKLCSPSPIFGLPSNIAYTTATTISATGTCQALGRDTIANQVCSIPAAPNGGLYEPINVGNCNVVSSFIAQPASTVSNTCAAVAQTFTVTVAAAPAPAPKPAPAPIPAPTPAPAPPTTCTYSGVYTIGSVACAGKFIAYNNDPKSNNACSNSTLMLRTDSQSKGSRKHWTINASAVSGTVPTAIGVIASGRTAKCPNDKYTNLAAANSSPTPRLAGSGWKNRIIPVDAAKGCDTVWIQAVGDNPYAGKYLGYGSCSVQTAFKWEAASSSSAIQWKLTKA